MCFKLFRDHSFHDGFNHTILWPQHAPTCPQHRFPKLFHWTPSPPPTIFVFDPTHGRFQKETHPSSSPHVGAFSMSWHAFSLTVPRLPHGAVPSLQLGGLRGLHRSTHRPSTPSLVTGDRCRSSVDPDPGATTGRAQELVLV